jgi:hypothetical protein
MAVVYMGGGGERYTEKNKPDGQIPAYRGLLSIYYVH